MKNWIFGLCVILCVIVSLNSCSVVKKRYSFGYNVHWNKSSDSKFKKKTSSNNKEYSAIKFNNSKFIVNSTSKITVESAQFKRSFEDSLIINAEPNTPNPSGYNRFVSVLNSPIKSIDYSLISALKKQVRNIKSNITAIKDIRKAPQENKAVYFDIELAAKILMTLAGIGAILFLLGMYWAYKNLYSNLAAPFIWTGLGVLGVCVAAVIILRIISLFMNW